MIIKNTKKVISLLLVLTLIFPQIALADLQAPVSDLDITNRSSDSGSDYSIELSWSRPYPSGQSDNEAYGTDKDSNHRATSYSLFYRNTSENEEYVSERKVDIQDPVQDKGNTETNSKLNYLFQRPFLQSGSIYSFYIDPSHDHLYEVILNDGPVYETRPANKSGENKNEVLYLTDIEVDAKINGPNMTVTWDNPTYMGNEIFTGYKIYYQRGGESVQNIPDNPSVVVNTDSEDLKRDGNKLTYTFQADNLDVGSVYAVKVEPIYGTTILRENPSPQIILGGQAYKIAFSNREYRTNDAYVSPGLYVMQEGAAYIRLYWDSLASTSFDIEKVEVYSSKSEQFDQSVLIGSIEGESAKKVNYWLASIPESLTYYKFYIYYREGTEIKTMESNIVYFDPSIFEFNPYMPNIMDISFRNSPQVSINILWEAFMRNAYTDEEKELINPTVNKFVDKSLDYKIWVTDDVSNYNIPSFENNHIKVIDSDTLFESEFIINEVTNEKTLVYSDLITGYRDYNLGESKYYDLEENKIYYIKVQAQRHLSGDLSKPSYYAVYIPPSTPIVTNPLSMNRPPFKVKLDENGVEEVTENSITVEWSTEWFEIYDEKTGEWYSKIGVDSTGSILVGDSVDSLPNSKKLLLDSDILFTSNLTESTSKIKSILKSMGAVSSEVDLLPVRYMDISNSNYELHTSTYENMENNGGYQSYFNTIKDDDTLWTGVEGTKNGDRKLVYTVTTANAPTVGPLDINTSYTIYFRNYIVEDNEKIYSEHPIYATATTLKNREDLIVTPPAQIIEFVSSTYDKITFRWEYSSQIDYELKYSNQMSDYSEGGTSVTSEEIEENKVLQTENGTTYIYYTVDNLFPNTTYYGWLKGTIGSRASEWSTATSGKTLDLTAPLKPRGVGLVSDEFLRVINIENSTSLAKGEPDNLIFEWSRITADNEDYGVTGISSVDSIDFFATSIYPNSYGVKFNDLKPNTKYYFRVRTILNAQKEGMGGNYFYSYEFEIADNINFKDSKIIFVPQHGLVADGVDILEVKSEWTSILTVVSGKTDEEYDGDINEDQYPMPLDDFDITYDKDSDTLKYEFRSNGLDSNGNENHYVDQRFITSLQQRGYFDFVVDVTDYEGIYPKVRIVEVPNTIIKAFSDTKASLTIVADNMQVTVNHNSFDSEKLITEDKGKVNFVFKLEPTLGNKLNNNQTYLSAPHNFNATITTGNVFKEVDMFSNDISVTLKPLNQYEAIDKNINMYEFKNDNWQLKNSSQKPNGSYELKTKIPNTYTLIASDIPISTNNDDSLYNLNKELIIKDMTHYVPQYDINTTQFNNIVYAMAMGNKEVNMNEKITQDKYNHLGKAGLLISGSYVTNEEGLSSLIRLYELKTGNRINTTNDNVPNSSTISPEYLNSIKKAYEIEMYSNIENFKSNMTFGDFVSYTDVILSDY